MNKITVTCVCGEEVAVPMRVAGAVLQSIVKKKRDPEKLREQLRQAAIKRWSHRIAKK
jgi:hypothetical protein